MRSKIEHLTRYDYTVPANGVVQLLRVEPPTTEDQHVIAWRVDFDVDGALRRGVDVFGNVTHMFYAEEPVRRLTLTVAGEVETRDAHGLLRGAPEPLEPLLFRRTTQLTQADDALRAFARELPQGSTLERLHALLEGVNSRVLFETGVTQSATDAATAFAQGAGVCQDHAQIFITVARLIGIPARYVSGHFVRSDGRDQQPAAHAWAEAHVEDLGWVGFDPANGISTTDQHVRVAIGLDSLDAAPVRGARRGGGAETLAVEVTAVDTRPRQTQSQSQLQ